MTRFSGRVVWKPAGRVSKVPAGRPGPRRARGDARFVRAGAALARRIEFPAAGCTWRIEYMDELPAPEFESGGRARP